MRVLIAVAAAAFGTSCYAPALDDCQFACSADEACPDGTACVAGMCRSGGATGACGAGAPTDASLDEPDGAELAIDASVACPASPCDGVPVAMGDRCGVVCAAQSFAAARATCDEGWQLAIVDSDDARAAFKAAFDQQVGWIGLSKTNVGVSGWQWLSTPAHDQPIDAAAHPPWAAAEPLANTLFATLDTTGATAVLATSPGPELAFCEYPL